MFKAETLLSYKEPIFIPPLFSFPSPNTALCTGFALTAPVVPTFHPIPSPVAPRFLGK